MYTSALALTNLSKLYALYRKNVWSSTLTLCSYIKCIVIFMRQTNVHNSLYKFWLRFQSVSIIFSYIRLICLYWQITIFQLQEQIYSNHQAPVHVFWKSLKESYSIDDFSMKDIQYFHVTPHSSWGEVKHVLRVSFSLRREPYWYVSHTRSSFTSP